jgi:hypothetical protein
MIGGLILIVVGLGVVFEANGSIALVLVGGAVAWVGFAIEVSRGIDHGQRGSRRRVRALMRASNIGRRRRYRRR